MVAVVTKTAAEGREGARGSRRCWPRLRLFKGRTWLITVLLKTLIFISNPDGIASLAYLLAGLAVFCFLFFFGWTCYLTVIYSAQGFRAVLWGKRVMVIIYQSTQFIECLLLFQESAREAPPGSSWRPRAGLASSPVPHPLPRPPGGCGGGGAAALICSHPRLQLHRLPVPGRVQPGERRCPTGARPRGVGGRGNGTRRQRRPRHTDPASSPPRSGRSRPACPRTLCSAPRAARECLPPAPGPRMRGPAPPQVAVSTTSAQRPSFSLRLLFPARPPIMETLLSEWGVNWASAFRLHWSRGRSAD